MSSLASDIPHTAGGEHGEASRGMMTTTAMEGERGVGSDVREEAQHEHGIARVPVLGWLTRTTRKMTDKASMPFKKMRRGHGQTGAREEQGVQNDKMLVCSKRPFLTTHTFLSPGRRAGSYGRGVGRGGGAGCGRGA